jgi:nucleoside-triphosphatase THEP1
MIAENNTNSAVNDEDDFVVDDEEVSKIELASIKVQYSYEYTARSENNILAIMRRNSLRNFNRRNRGSKTTRTCTSETGSMEERERKRVCSKPL